MARPATPRDPYEVLGVPRRADDAEIQQNPRSAAVRLRALQRVQSKGGL